MPVWSTLTQNEQLNQKAKSLVFLRQMASQTQITAAELASMLSSLLPTHVHSFENPSA
jgi:hypothetical protein